MRQINLILNVFQIGRSRKRLICHSQFGAWTPTLPLMKFKTNGEYQNKIKRSNKWFKNYHPISNLSSDAKITRKLILKCLTDIQTESKVDLTGNEQQGFKKTEQITATTEMILQSFISQHFLHNLLRNYSLAWAFIKSNHFTVHFLIS